MHDVSTLDDYLARYGRLLAAQAEQSLRPLHRPGIDPARVAELPRKPFDSQRHVITAAAKALSQQRSLLVVGEIRSGKILLGMGILHKHAAGQPYLRID